MKFTNIKNRNSEIVVRISECCWDEVTSFMLESTNEQVAFLYGKITYLGRRTLITVNRQKPILLGQDCYVSNGRTAVKVQDEVMRQIYFDYAKAEENVLINIHSHPFQNAGTTFSSIDDRDDLAQASYLSKILNDDIAKFDECYGKKKNHVLSLVTDKTSVDARLVQIEERKARFISVSKIQVIGPSLHTIIPNKKLRDKLPTSANEKVNRHKSFIPSKGIKWLHQTKFLIGGVGGTGSILGESLLRLGANYLILLDDDHVEESNLNRWQSGRESQIGEKKVSAYARNLKLMFPSANIRIVKDSIFTPNAHRAIAESDFVFGCFDNHIARYYLNRMTSQYMLPYLDTGVEINVDEVSGIDFISRYFLSLPSHGHCLECSPVEMLDMIKVRAAYTDQSTHQAMRDAGYIVLNDEEPTPSAYAHNMQAISSMLLDLIGCMNGIKMPLMAYYQWSQGVISKFDYPNVKEYDACPVCDFLAGKTTAERPNRPPSHDKLVKPDFINELMKNSNHSNQTIV